MPARQREERSRRSRNPHRALLRRILLRTPNARWLAAAGRYPKAQGRRGTMHPRAVPSAVRGWSGADRGTDRQRRFLIARTSSSRPCDWSPHLIVTCRCTGFDDSSKSAQFYDGDWTPTSPAVLQCADLRRRTQVGSTPPGAGRPRAEPGFPVGVVAEAGEIDQVPFFFPDPTERSCARVPPHPHRTACGARALFTRTSTRAGSRRLESRRGSVQHLEIRRPQSPR